MCKENCVNRSRQTESVSRQKCIKWRKNQTTFPPPSCLLFSLVSTGVWGDSSGQEDVLCCGWGPVSDDHSSYGCFPADFSSGCRTGKSCPHKQQFFTILCTYQNFKVKHISISQMEASYVSMILFVSRAWDAVSDPLVGYLVGRSNWTPIGKLTPWLVGGATCWTHFILN